MIICAVAHTISMLHSLEKKIKAHPEINKNVNNSKEVYE